MIGFIYQAYSVGNFAPVHVINFYVLAIIYKVNSEKNELKTKNRLSNIFNYLIGRSQWRRV